MTYHQLSEYERYAIARLLRQGYSKRGIARVLDRHPTTIIREIERNATNHDGAYRPEKAQQYAVARRRRSRRNLQFSAQDWAPIAKRIQDKWSPAQIVGRALLFRRHTMSAATIYRYVRLDRKRGGHLWRHLRIVSKFGRKCRGSPHTRGRIIGKRHISERPAVVERRRQLGHWEGDTVVGADQRHCILTLVERTSGFTIIKKLVARNVQQANQAMTQAIQHLNTHFRTITLDNGTEFHGYADVELETGVTFFFATPYHSWERGTNENTNGLIRQYLPKGSCFKALTQADCNRIAKQLNDRPRDRLGFKTPSEVFFKAS